MKLFFLLTLTISYIALSKAINAYEASYSYVLGPLEIFWKSGKNDIMECYKKYKNDYEDSLNSFYKRVTEIKHLFDTAFQIRQPYKNHMDWGFSDMNLIVDTLKSFFEKFNEKITAGHLYDGGMEMASKREKIEGHYKWYETHKNNLDNVHSEYHDQVFAGVMDQAFEKIYENTTDVTDKVLECLKSKGVTYAKKKN